MFNVEPPLFIKSIEKLWNMISLKAYKEICFVYRCLLLDKVQAINRP